MRVYSAGKFACKPRSAPWAPFRTTRRPPKITADNPAGTDGFEFVEFAHPEPEKLDALFAPMGFAPVARHRTKDITV